MGRGAVEGSWVQHQGLATADAVALSLRVEHPRAVLPREHAWPDSEADL